MDEVFVPEENRLGEENAGFYLVMANFQWERLLMALGSVGAVTAADFSTYIELLGTQGKTRVLSSPRVSTLNNQKAVIKSGSDQYFVIGVSTNTVVGTAASTNLNVDLAPFFSGVALDVTPQISEQGEVAQKGPGVAQRHRESVLGARRQGSHHLGRQWTGERGHEDQRRRAHGAGPRRVPGPSYPCDGTSGGQTRVGDLLSWLGCS